MSNSENPIARYMRETGLTQDELSRLTGIPAPMLSEWRRDLKHPSLQSAFALEKATKGRVTARSWVGREIQKAS